MLVVLKYKKKKARFIRALFFVGYSVFLAAPAAERASETTIVSNLDKTSIANPKGCSAFLAVANSEARRFWMHKIYIIDIGKSVRSVHRIDLSCIIHPLLRVINAAVN